MEDILATGFTGTARFRVIRLIGQGGMGVVYEVEDQASGERMALKTLHTVSGNALWRLKNEFRALQDLQHENLIHLGELHKEGDFWFFTMELIEGSDFLSYVRSSPSAPAPQPARAGDTPQPARFDEHRLRQALAQLAAGLGALHAAGKVHRDIKPPNCLITTSGRLVILDFGLITHATHAAHTARGSSSGDHRDLVGTVMYMAPEQAASRAIGPEADLYSVGVMLYEVLTGVLPFSGHELSVLDRKQHTLPPRPLELVPDVPADLDALCMDLLAIQPELRPAAGALLGRLGRPPMPAGKAASRMHTGSVAAPALVGRTGEIAALERALHDSRHDRAVSVVLTGESGVGKSMLCAHFAERVAEQHPLAVILAGRCYERESVPYKAFDDVIDMLAEHLHRLPATEAAAILPRRAALLAQVFPVLERVEAIAGAPRPSARDDDQRSRRQHLFAALRELLAKLAERHPLLITIDDLQWSDADSMALLEAILCPPDAPPLLLIATARTGQVIGQDIGQTSLPMSLSLPGDVRELEIPRLPHDEACELARLLMPEHARWSRTAIEAIAREAEGHPLFIAEIIQQTSESGNRATSYSDNMQLEDVLWARIQLLEPHSRTLIELVCVACVKLDQAVAAAALGVGAADLDALVKGLELGRLVRLSGLELGRALEPYHDRVRAAVHAHLDEDVRRHHHQVLAECLERYGADAEPLAWHWQQAGRYGKAARFAAQAAAHAARALAFDRAAHLYRTALAQVAELGGDPEIPADHELAAWQVGLAEALINSGHGGEAPALDLTAAEHSGARSSHELRRLAVEHYLQSGQSDEGHVAAGEQLAELQLDDAAGAGPSTMLGLIGWRAWLRLRGMGTRARHESEIDPRDLMKIDLYWSLAASMGFRTDSGPFQAANLVTRHLLLALRAGEPYRLVRAFCLEAMFSASRHGKRYLRASELCRRAAALAGELDNPHAHAMVSMTEGVLLFGQGSWRSALVALDRADAIIRDQCKKPTGSPMAQQLGAAALVYLGELAELCRRVPEIMQRARELDNVQLGVNIGCGVAYWITLAGDEPERARAELDTYTRQWSGRRFSTQEWNALLANIDIDLYQDDWRSAQARLARAWPQAHESTIMQIQRTRIEAELLHARCALAAACALPPDERGRFIARARSGLARVQSERMSWTTPLIALMRAGIAAVSGDRDRAAALLGEATSGFQNGQMALLAAVAAYRRGQLLGGDTGADVRAEAAAAMHARGVRMPCAMAAMLAPGFADYTP